MTEYEAYDKLFSKYPDVVTVKDVSEMLGLGIRNTYKLFSDGKGNTAQSPPDGLAAHLLASFPSSCTEIPCWAPAQRRHFYTI